MEQEGKGGKQTHRTGGPLVYVGAHSLPSEMPLTGVQYREKSKKPSDRLSANARRATLVIYHVAVKIFDLWIGNIAVYGCQSVEKSTDGSW